MRDRQVATINVETKIVNKDFSGKELSFLLEIYDENDNLVNKDTMGND